jgi:CBS domain-containing protein
MPVKTLAVDVVTTTRDETVPDVARTMRDEELGDVVVVKDGRPVGIVTDRDVAMAVADSADVADRTVGDIMTPDPITIHEDATASALPETMAEGGVRRIPVVDDDGHLVGIATLDDVVATVGEMVEVVAAVMETQSRAYEPSP